MRGKKTENGIHAALRSAGFAPLLEIAGMLNADKQTLLGWIKRGHVDKVQAGREFWANKESVLKYAAANQERNRALARRRFGARINNTLAASAVASPVDVGSAPAPCICEAHVARLESLVTRLEAVLGTSGGK